MTQKPSINCLNFVWRYFLFDCGLPRYESIMSTPRELHNSINKAEFIIAYSLEINRMITLSVAARVPLIEGAMIGMWDPSMHPNTLGNQTSLGSLVASLFVLLDLGSEWNQRRKSRVHLIHYRCILRAKAAKYHDVKQLLFKNCQWLETVELQVIELWQR